MARIRSQIHPVESKFDGVGMQRPHFLSIPDVSTHRSTETIVPQRDIATVLERHVHSTAPVVDVELPFTIHQQHGTETVTRERVSTNEADGSTKWSKLTGALSVGGLWTRRYLAMVVLLSVVLAALALAAVLRPTRSSEQGGVSVKDADVRQIDRHQNLRLRAETAKAQPKVGARKATGPNIFHVPTFDVAEPKSDTTVRSKSRSTPSPVQHRTTEPRGANQGLFQDPRQPSGVFVRNVPMTSPQSSGQRQSQLRFEESQNVAVQSTQRRPVNPQSRDDRGTTYESTDPSKYRYPHYSVPSMVRRQTTER